ncbi:hypothetical protein ABPG75_006822 [Micractinium tetrahymenae]
MDGSDSAADATVSLPDHLLGAVIGLAGQEAGRWHRLFWEEGSAWRRVTLDCSQLGPRVAPEVMQRRFDWLESRTRLLARVARHVRHLSVGPLLSEDSPPHHRQTVQRLFRLLPSQLTSLELSMHCAIELAATAQSLPALERFSLRIASLKLPAGATSGLLSRMPRLRSLELDMEHCDAPVLAAIAGLACLTELSLHSRGSPVFSPPTQQAALAKLSLWGKSSAASLASIVHWPNLTSLRLCIYPLQMLETLQGLPSLQKLQHLAVLSMDSAGPGQCPTLAAVQRQLARLPALVACELELRGRSGLAFGIQCGQAVLHDYKYSVSEARGERSMGLSMALGIGARELRSLQTVLDALVPAGNRLTRLSLCTSYSLPAAALQACPSLGQLAALRLDWAERPGPEGDELGPSLPPALASATALNWLVLDGNVKLALTEADVAGVLAGMPRLRLLSLQRTAGAAREAVVCLRSNLPLLEVRL